MRFLKVPSERTGASTASLGTLCILPLRSLRSTCFNGCVTGSASAKNSHPCSCLEMFCSASARGIELRRRGGAERAEIHPTYFPLAQQEALCWLGAGAPRNAQDALDRFPISQRYPPRGAKVWLAAFVALHQGNLLGASKFLSSYLDANAPTTGAGIRASLLREWDHRVATFGEVNPAMMWPILPPSVTGLEVNVLRPQYGPPVLLQHQSQPQPTASQNGRVRILALGTEWHSGHGGLSTFNRQLCRALAAAGAEVICVVLRASREDERDAETQGVKLVEARRTPGVPEQFALLRKPKLPGDLLPDVIIGHGRVTGPAAQILAQDHFPVAQRLHFVHMAPDEIEWFKLDRDDDAGARAEDRTQIELDLGRTAARVIAVGPRLHNRYERDLHPYGVPSPLRLDPGFDAQSISRNPPPGAPWTVLLLGRLEDDYLKGLDLAAKAVGLAAKRREPGAVPLELVVRGARPDTATELHRILREWSGLPSLSVLVRPFTTVTESLDADIKRASLLLMPSRSEGFGLVGLEAIVAGTPVLVSSASGLGAMLRETLEREQAGRIVVPMSGDDEQDGKEWGHAVEGMLRDCEAREAAFRRAMEVRALLATQKTWADAVADWLAEFRKLPGAPSAPA